MGAMNRPAHEAYVSRGGEKLAAALDRFDVAVDGLRCADLGSHVGGFVDCLLRRGAATVFSVDTCYGTLAWKLRKDPRVVVFERTNAMHVALPAPADVITIDAGWTTQARLLPNAARLLAGSGCVVSLIKPHYEAPKHTLVDGVLPDAAFEPTVTHVLEQIEELGWTVVASTPSPIRGHGGNQELFAHLVRTPLPSDTNG